MLWGEFECCVIDQHKKAFREDTLIYSVLFNDGYDYGI